MTTGRIPALALMAWLVACGGSQPSEAHGRPAPVPTGSVEAALGGSHRSEAHRARDRYRHPRETLEFFGLRPESRVVELWPEGAWYTEVLAPIVRGRGSLTVATMDPRDETFRGRLARELVARLEARPDVFDHVSRVTLFPPYADPLGPPGSADLVLSFRSAHNWIRWPGHDPGEVFRQVAEVLRPGGVFGFVQHRAPVDDASEEAARAWAPRGYVPEAYIVRLAEEAGLRLEASSDINRNPLDDHDHPEGVWSLPPTLRSGDTAEWRDIGESDRMTLRFRKPGGSDAAGP